MKSISLFGAALLLCGIWPASALATPGLSLCHRGIVDQLQIEGVTTEEAKDYVLHGVTGSRKMPPRSRLYYAAVLGMTTQLRQLLGNAHHNSADPDAHLLIDTAAAGETGSMAILLEAGLDPNLRPKNRLTALTVAAECHESQIMAYLIAANADVYATDQQGMDPMMTSVAEGFLSGVQLLLAGGYDVARQKTESGLSIVDLAKRKGDQRIIRLIQFAQSRTQKPHAP